MMRRIAASLAFLCLPGFAQEPACTIRGMVVDAANNRPMVRARVIAEVRGSHSFLRLTDDRGGFCFEHLTPARYHIVVQKAGYAEEEHGVTLAVEENSEVKPIAIRMTAYASISGVALDPDGNPLPGAKVTAWERVRVKGGWGRESIDEVESDSNGAFHIDQLNPGYLYLSVNGSNRAQERYVFPFRNSRGQVPPEKEVETFYSGSLTLAGATPVKLQAGQKLEGLVLTLRRAPLRRISGHIANAPPSGFLSFVEEAESQSYNAGEIPIEKDGSFSHESLPAGKYTLQLAFGGKLAARKDVDLTNGDAVGIALNPIETVDVRVTFRTEDNGPAFRPLTQGWGDLRGEGSDELVAGHTADDGTYRFEDVPRGVYRVQIDVAGQRLYVKKIAYSGEELRTPKVDLRAGQPGALEVTLSPNVAEVHGRAVAPADRPDGDASEEVTVILVDAGNGDDVRIAARTGIDQKGRFNIPPVPPGKYRLFAIEDFELSPKALKALAGKSVELELKENEKKQVSVTVISSAEWKAAMKNTAR
jgi:hypothetical protein